MSNHRFLGSRNPIKATRISQKQYTLQNPRWLPKWLLYPYFCSFLKTNQYKTVVLVPNDIGFGDKEWNRFPQNYIDVLLYIRIQDGHHQGHHICSFLPYLENKNDDVGVVSQVLWAKESIHRSISSCHIQHDSNMAVISVFWKLHHINVEFNVFV